MAIRFLSSFAILSMVVEINVLSRTGEREMHGCERSVVVVRMNRQILSVSSSWLVLT